jgi:hypothetical protein
MIRAKMPGGGALHEDLRRRAPATVALSGTSAVTTEPAPITDQRPIVKRGRMTAPLPTKVPSPIAVRPPIFAPGAMVANLPIVTSCPIVQFTCSCT